MIVRSGQPGTLRDIFDRFGFVSIQRRVRRYCRPYLKRRKHTFATLGVWSFLSDLAGRNEVLLYEDPSSLVVFARIAGRIPRMSALMSWASAGTHRYPTAGSAGVRASGSGRSPSLLQTGISVYCQRPATWI
jgi:hypothetical protein